MRSFNNKGSGTYAYHCDPDAHTILSALSILICTGHMLPNQENSGHIARMGQKSAYKDFVKHPEQDRPLQELEIDERALECILTKQEGRMSNAII